MLFLFLIEGVGVVGVDGWDTGGKTPGMEGDPGMASVPFPADLGRDSSIMSDNGDLVRDREALLCLEGVVNILQYPGKPISKSGGKFFLLLFTSFDQRRT